jgi:membrane fusion protein (multidrug efflux system)
LGKSPRYPGCTLDNPTTSRTTMKFSLAPVILLAAVFPCLPACQKLEAQGTQPPSQMEHGQETHSQQEHAQEEHGQAEHGHEEHSHKIVVTSPIAKDMVSTQQYVCQIHSCRHIEVCALEGGYLEQIAVKEGQSVQQGELLFKILPTLYEARLASDVAEAQLAQIELQNTERLFQQNVVAQPEVALAQAKLAKAQAKVNLARAELDFASVKAPFDGIVDKQHVQQGSLVAEGDILTTLSDNSVMWAYFNVPEARYLQYQQGPHDDLKVELKLANGKIFPQIGAIGAIEADFNNETGNIAFRADFANPTRLLRHGQTGTILLSQVVKDAIVIPQRATFEILAKKYAFVVGDDDVVHQREIEIQTEMDDIYLIKEGLDVNDKIILEGIRQVRDGEKVEYEFHAPEEVLDSLKYHAE